MKDSVTFERPNIRETDAFVILSCFDIRHSSF
jgi:hypothetical protein